MIKIQHLSHPNYLGLIAGINHYVLSTTCVVTDLTINTTNKLNFARIVYITGGSLWN